MLTEDEETETSKRMIRKYQEWQDFKYDKTYEEKGRDWMILLLKGIDLIA